ncbi:hypothetical protein [Pseudobutyrivibrio sp. MD2005]|uniref:hypothetical protein n=1 Tax=Pseudobutyrivibrio sp. MD2005 TaxID=1410616 RepID=UPI0004850819|nr:hypothetical protein [Pseudobutyrivibrio sp. MD2005]
MIQEKYNRQIFDEGTEDAILRLSHLRSNVLSPVRIQKSERVLIIDPDSEALVEWLKETAEEVTVALTEEIRNIKDKFNIIISLGSLNETPTILKERLASDGKLVYALPEKAHLADFTKRLLKEAGFDNIETFRVSPDYLFTTEIYAEDYIGGGAGDYLLIAR